MLRILATIGLGCLAVATVVVVDSTLDDARSVAAEERGFSILPGSDEHEGVPNTLPITCHPLVGDSAVVSEPVYLGGLSSDDTTLYGLMTNEDFDTFAWSNGLDRFPGQDGAPTLAEVRRGLRADLGLLCQQERATQQTDVLASLGTGALKLGIIAALTAAFGPMLVGKRPWRRRPVTEEPSTPATGVAA